MITTSIAAVLLCVVACQQPALDADYSIQGEYTGQVSISGNKQQVGLQVIALGDSKFSAKWFEGGLPGSDGKNPVPLGESQLADQTVRFTHDDLTIQIADQSAQVSSKDTAVGELKRVQRTSPTLGLEPPQGAVVLFGAGGNPEDVKQYAQLWQAKGQPGRISDNGCLMEGATSKQKFQSHRIHIEFRLPYQPDARGQQRGNSGIYVQGRYEVQMLDSFGLEGKNNECGGIYSIKKPDLNMCFPPMQWQTYDIDFTAAKFKDGKKVADAVMTVKHNGVVIHDQVKLPRSTTAAPLKDGPDPGPVYLQNHGNPVRYANIWVIPQDE